MRPDLFLQQAIPVRGSSVSSFHLIFQWVRDFAPPLKGEISVSPGFVDANS